MLRGIRQIFRGRDRHTDHELFESLETWKTVSQQNMYPTPQAIRAVHDARHFAKEGSAEYDRRARIRHGAWWRNARLYTFNQRTEEGQLQWLARRGWVGIGEGQPGEEVIRRRTPQEIRDIEANLRHGVHWKPSSFGHHDLALFRNLLDPASSATTEAASIARGLATPPEQRAAAVLEAERAAVAAADAADRREAEEAEAAEAAVARMGMGIVAEGRVNACHVHKEARKFESKIPEILSIIKEDLGTNKDYSNIVTFLENTIGKYIHNSPEFDKIKNKNITRNNWIELYNNVMKPLRGAPPLDKADRIGNIIDFMFKHNLQECFIKGFIYDSAKAYEGDRYHKESVVSCYNGIIERISSTFINCISGVEGDVFNRLRDILDIPASSWEELSKGKAKEYTMSWDNFFEKWIKRTKNNSNIRAKEPEARFEVVMVNYKKENPIPEFVEKHFRDLYSDRFRDENGWNVFYNRNLNVTMNNGPKTSNNNIQKAQKAQMEKIRAARALAAAATNGSSASGGKRRKTYRKNRRNKRRTNKKTGSWTKN